jgi:LmbE family N-acetylglucosaminyl deacetylase
MQSFLLDNKQLISLKKYILGLIFLFAASFQLEAQKPISYSSSEIISQIKKLNVVGSVLYIAAHPDDENTKLLAYLSNEKRYRTGYLSLTRGDGGQNLIGDEQGVELGLIRTQELLAARRIDGAEQFFSSAYDFGYSKNPDEALSIWNHHQLLSDVVWVIRKFRPDIIICRFPTTGEGGHGQHTASAILAEEAFDVAADSTKFKEQFLQGVTVWQAKRLLWNTFSFGTVNTQKEDQFKIDIGAFNPLLGKSYGEISADSRSQHKSQGFGVPAQRGNSIEYFKTIKGTAPVNDLFDEIQTDWSRFSKDSTRLVKDIFDLEDKAPWQLYSVQNIQNCIDSLVMHFKTEKPAESINHLLSLYNLLFNQQSKFLYSLSYWSNIKCKEIASIIEKCGGFYMEAIASSPKVVIGDSMFVNYSFINRSNSIIDKADINFDGHHFNYDVTKFNQTINKSDTLIVGQNKKISQPYWLHDKIKNGCYRIDSYDELGNPESQSNCASFYLNISGTPLFYQKNLKYKYTDPIKGEIYQPVNYIPPVYLEPNQSLVIRKINQKPSITVIVTANRNITLHSLKANDKELLLDTDLRLIKNEKKEFNVLLEDGVTKFSAFEDSFRYDQYAKEINYDHIPSITYFRDAEVNCKYINVNIEKKKIGYLEGAGDKVAELLSQIGYDVVPLKKENITTGYLKQFNAIITGVRAYNINDWMNEVYDVLMNYIKQGGNLIVQYNTNNQIGPLKVKIGPYPFNISRNRVTDENAKVKILNDKCSVFNYPNKIDNSDFENWIQERSIYHATDIDAHYEKLLNMHDPNEKEDEGSIIMARYGKGRFIYTGLSLFRQLPAGVAGAYRLFANLINVQ